MKKVPPSADDAYRLIGIGVGHLLPSGQQQSLWQEAAEKAV
jgi:DNA polymerase-4